jgi:beta-lactam-binding protein with PASTA domain
MSFRTIVPILLAGMLAVGSCTQAPPAAVDVTVPNVVGLQQDRATNDLTSVGLNVTKDVCLEAGNFRTHGDYVATQVSQARARVHRGAAVHLHLC